MFAQQVCCFAVPVSDLDEVVPVEAGEKALKPSAREMLQDAGDKHKTFVYLHVAQNYLPDRFLGPCHSHICTHLHFSLLSG